MGLCAQGDKAAGSSHQTRPEIEIKHGYKFCQCLQETYSATSEVLEASRATINLNTFKNTLASGLAAK